MKMLGPAIAVCPSMFDVTLAHWRRRGRASRRDGLRAGRFAAKLVCSRWGGHVRS